MHVNWTKGSIPNSKKSTEYDNRHLKKVGRYNDQNNQDENVSPTYDNNSLSKKDIYNACTYIKALY